jgi:ATP-dependent DNA ligase
MALTPLSQADNDFTQRFIAEVSLAGLRSKSCIFDGEAVVCDTTALRPSSQMLRMTAPT